MCFDSARIPASRASNVYIGTSDEPLYQSTSSTASSVQKLVLQWKATLSPMTAWYSPWATVEWRKKNIRNKIYKKRLRLHIKLQRTGQENVYKKYYVCTCVCMCVGYLEVLNMFLFTRRYRFMLSKYFSLECEVGYSWRNSKIMKDIKKKSIFEGKSRKFREKIGKNSKKWWSPEWKCMFQDIDQKK